MKARGVWMAVSLVACVATSLFAQDGRRDFCVGKDECIPDSLEVVFQTAGDPTSTLEFASFTAGTQIDAVIETDTKTAKIQGWSFAVKHDPEALNLINDSVTTAGTTVDDVFSGGFNATGATTGGLVSAVVLSFVSPAELPIARNALCKASYTLQKDVGAAGTKIEPVSGEIGPANSPPTDINLTVDGVSKEPAVIVDGIVRIVAPQVDCEDWALYFGDAATTDAVDAKGAASLKVSSRNVTDAFAFQVGIKAVESAGEFALGFSGELGTDADRLVELVITDDQGDSQTPVTPNTAVTSAMPTSVARGAAIAAFADGDFFAFDLEPGVGGPGLTVGYVSDLDGDVNKIPATAAVEGCPVNEILVLGLEAAPENQFFRGDIDANGKINITDAVLVIQVVLGNLPERFDCDDALDTNDDGKTDISDALPILMYMFQRGEPLAAPFLGCGVDPTADDVPCNQTSPFCAAP